MKSPQSQDYVGKMGFRAANFASARVFRMGKRTYQGAKTLPAVFSRANRSTVIAILH